MTWGMGRLAAALGLSAAAAVAAGAPDPVQAGDSAAGTSVTLRYRAFVAGAPVGEALVDVTVTDDGYLVQGDARSHGWLKGVTGWRNRFSARGRLAGAGKRPSRFAYTETDRSKHRRVVVEGDTLQVTKNGKARPPRIAPGGADVISALFVQPHCQGDHVLHTGRHVYRLSRVEPTSATCRYAVVDDDDDTFEIDLELGDRAGLVIPQKILVRAWVSGWVELVEGEVED